MALFLHLDSSLEVKIYQHKNHYKYFRLVGNFILLQNVTKAERTLNVECFRVEILQSMFYLRKTKLKR